MSAPPLSSWHAQRSAGDGGTRVFNREWRAHGDPPQAPRVTRKLTMDQVEEIRASKDTLAQLAERFGAGITTIRLARSGWLEGTPSSEPFIPLCMTPDELADWDKHNRTAAFAAHGAARTPCEDCLLGYALEMRAIGKCNGTPGAAADVEDDEPEEPAVRRTMANLKVTVSAPCETCVHLAVCGRRESILAIQQGDLAVDHSALRSGLTLALTATVDCDAYLPVKKVRTGPAATLDADGRNPLTGRRPQSLEQRLASSERMKATRARQRAEREAAEAVD